MQLQSSQCEPDQAWTNELVAVYMAPWLALQIQKIIES